MKLKGYIILLLGVFLNGFILAQTTLDRIQYASDLYFSNPDSSYLICKEVEEKLKNTRNQIEIGEAQLCQARYLLLKTRFDEATTKLNSAISIFEEENRISSLAKCHSLKAILLDRISNDDEALQHQRKAYNLYVKAKDLKGQVSSLTNLSLDFIEAGQNDSSLFYLNKLLEYEDQMKSTSRYFLHQNFAMYYYNTKDYPAAISSFEKALQVAEDLQMIDSKATCLMLTAKVYLAQKKYQQAEELLLKSLAIAQENQLLHETNEAYIKLIELYESQGNYKQAFATEKLNDQVEKEIYNLDKINKINEIESQLKLKEKETIIAQKELDIKNEQLNTMEARSEVTQLIYLVALFVLVLIFVVIILLRTRKLNSRIQTQKLMLEEKNTEITDSINYAKRIQSAILPSTESFTEHLPDSFILYKPKDIVAGDFYWMQTIRSNEGGVMGYEPINPKSQNSIPKTQNTNPNAQQPTSNNEPQNVILFAAADCTGHGVPGALVSVVCSNALNQSLKELGNVSPSEILEETRRLVKDRFSKGNETNVKDGMDIALCSLNKNTNVVEFAGANNPLWIIRNKESAARSQEQEQYLSLTTDNYLLYELKGDKQPVGNHFKEKPFTGHQEQLQSGDILYIFSDGFADQFGGPKGKKFMYSQLKELLLSIAHKPLQEQRQVLDQTFESWKGDLEQLDDVCFIGVRI
ncbi:MAG: SpoIIE family protein phosphatase [Flavobacteriales bacterium]|nr:SpoIIE family protein phosphatase [Flavobacteriales bacterium]